MTEHPLTAGLTVRQLQVAELMARGHPNYIIAQKLCISPRTVNTHITEIFLKLEVTNRSQVMGWYHDLMARREPAIAKLPATDSSELRRSLGYIASDLLGPVARQKKVSKAVERLIAGIREQARQHGIQSA